jgi:hypothetical protein
MLVSELGRRLGLQAIQDSYEDRALSSGYTSDLLSDVMANARADCAFITIQAHKNSVAVASLVGVAAIILCNGREAPPDMVEAAKAEGIAVLGSRESQFELSGRLWSALREEDEARLPSPRG